MDNIQKEYFDGATRLQQELINAGFMASRVVKGEDRTDYFVTYFDGTRDYRIVRDWQGHINVTRREYPNYENVSSHVRGQTWTKYKGQNVKVITAKKLQKKIDEENAYHDEMQTLNALASDKMGAFIAEMQEMEKDGYTVVWNKERGGHRDGEIRGGEVVENGIEFSFEFHDDGYISKKVRVHYSVDNTLEAFKRLSSNRYI